MTYTFKLARRLASNHRAASVLVLAVLAGACGSSPTGPDVSAPPVTSTGGWLTVQLTTPNSNDGAVQLAVTGPGVDSIRVVAPYSGFSNVPSSGSAHIVVTGNVASSAVARVWVRDVSRAAQVTATVRAAAARGTYAVSEISAYRVAVIR